VHTAALFAGVALARAAIKVDGRLPSAAGGGTALCGVSDGAAAGGALLHQIRIGDADGTGLNLGAVEDGMREVLGFGGEVAGRGESFRHAPRANRVGVACGCVFFLAVRGDQPVVKRVREGKGAQGKEADRAKRWHVDWKLGVELR
jgi:hypothetical protein